MKRINAQRAVIVRKVIQFEAEKKGKIDQGNCTSIRHSQQKSLEYPEKEGNCWSTHLCINNQISNEKIKAVDDKHCEICEDKSKN